MNPIKESFRNVKKDINFLKQAIEDLRKNLKETNKKLEIMFDFLEKEDKNSFFSGLKNQTHNSFNSTHNSFNSTHKSSFKPLKNQNMGISIGNEGASTDRQTDRQTDRWPKKSDFLDKNYGNSIKDASTILESLDEVKKEIRKKFKKLTNQELLVFSKIYQLDEEKGYSDYRTLSEALDLTESSIRDYIFRLIKKGIPIEKKKINNKAIHISISSNLKKITTLSTILQLRDI